MAFERIFVEKSIAERPATLAVLKKINALDRFEIIEKYDDYFGRVKKPYLHKRNQLNLYLAEKKGQLVKEAPDAYGLAGAPHFYFVHAYNCIYECEYCYLQGYFNSPDIVLFTNHDEISKEIIRHIHQYPNQEIWFHAGEFSDSLALSQISGELELYHQLFKKFPHARLELRTKSANTKVLESLDPLDNMITSFSMSPQSSVKKYDHKTAALKLRLKAMEKLSMLGHPVAIHLDPIIWSPNWESDYQELVHKITETINPDNIRYVSIGVVRFPKKMFKDIKNNYPDSDLVHQPLITTTNDLVRYRKPLRFKILNTVESMLKTAGFKAPQIYKCME
tara:strand:+ start:7280 stop:8284 length:1005 start_codon:yes stop_codon:yes gene_type:complete